MRSSVGQPRLAVVHGLKYTDEAQVFARCLLPTYQTAFRWTGNRADSEDATEWALLTSARRLRLPELVSVVDEHRASAAAEAVARHWSERYGVDPGQCANACKFESSSIQGRPQTLESLFARLPADMRLVLVLRFLRRRSPAAIAGQLGLKTEAARRQVLVALSKVGERLGLAEATGDLPQTEHLSAFVDDIISGGRPVRFEARFVAWPAMVAACHVQAAIAGNDLPPRAFLRSLEGRFQASLDSRLVTDPRICSA